MRQEVRTVVFADLSGSTRLFEQIGNLAAARIICSAIDTIAAHLQRGGGVVVKSLGDGLLVHFADCDQALESCAGLIEVIADVPALHEFDTPLYFKVGVECGVVVIHDSDLYGTAVNVAARLSAVAQRNEMLIGEGAHARLGDHHRLHCLALDRISVRGCREPVAVWRYLFGDYLTDEPITQMLPVSPGGFRFDPVGERRIALEWGAQSIRVIERGEPSVQLGRGASMDIRIDDRRASRRHASIGWDGGSCVLSDFSSNGTWVVFAGMIPALHLHRDMLQLHGAGEIHFGIPPGTTGIAALRFRLQA